MCIIQVVGGEIRDDRVQHLKAGRSQLEARNLLDLRQYQKGGGVSNDLDEIWRSKDSHARRSQFATPKKEIK